MSKKSTRVGVRYDQVDAYGRVNPRLPLIDDLASFLPYHTELNVYKDGTEQLLPVNTSEPTTSPILADIRYPTGVWRNKQYFTYRKSPTEATGKARIKCIKGNTLVWNQLVQNGNFADTSNWISTGTSFSVSNNEATFVGEQYKSFTQDLYLTNGHKILFIAKCKQSGTGQALFKVRKYTSVSSYTDDNTTITTTYQTLYKMLDISSDLIFEKIIFQNNANESVTINVKDVMAIDLTLMGLDTLTLEQVQAWFSNYFPLNYYAYGQSLLNFNGSGIKTTGRNLFDGTVYSNNHGINASGVIYSTTGYKVYTVTLPVGNYVASVTNFSTNPSQAFRIMNVDSSNTKLTLDGGTVGLNERKSFTFSVPSGTAQTLISVYNNHGDVQVEFGSIATDYEPYTSSTTSLPISTYFPTGMKSAGTGTSKVYDELNDKATTRVGSVDLGSLTWSYDTSHRFVTNDLQSLIKLPTSSAEYDTGLLCARYEASKQPILNPSSTDKTISKYTNGTVYICDSSYTDATTFKTAMSGVYLNYELAEYVEVSTLNLGE